MPTAAPQHAPVGQQSRGWLEVYSPPRRKGNAEHLPSCHPPRSDGPVSAIAGGRTSLEGRGSTPEGTGLFRRLKQPQDCLAAPCQLPLPLQPFSPTETGGQTEQQSRAENLGKPRMSPALSRAAVVTRPLTVDWRARASYQ